MDRCIKMLQFEIATLEDAGLLAEVSAKAFNNDINYGAQKEQGPPGYDSADWQKSMMSNRQIMYYKILYDNSIIGGFLIFNKGFGYYELARIFIDPLYQNQGIGTATFDFIWQEFPEAKKWSLETPAWNQRTQHFYKKVGFNAKESNSEGIRFEKIVK